MTATSEARARRLGWVLAGAAGAVAALVRAIYAFGSPRALFPGDDNTWYVSVAHSVANGSWGRLPGLTGGDVWSFRFPPGYPWVLALGERVLFWVDAVDAARGTSVLCGAVGAVLIARLGWRWTAAAPLRARVVVAGVAGGVFALGPIAAGPSAALMSESLFVPLVAGVLLAVDHLLEPEPDRIWTIALCGLVALGALTRVEGLVYLGAPVVAGMVLARRRRSTIVRLGAAVAVGLVVVAAWSGFATVEAGRPVPVAANGGPMLGANCHAAQYGEAAGYWLGDCLAIPGHRFSAHARRVLATPERPQFGVVTPAGADVEAEVSQAQQREAVDRIVSDPAGFLHAVPFRIARAFGVYWSPTQKTHEIFEGRDPDWERVGRWFHLAVVLPLVLLALIALMARRTGIGRRLRRAMEPKLLVPSAALVGVWIVGIVVTYGSARLRAPIEPVLALLAGLGASVLVGPGSDAQSG